MQSTMGKDEYEALLAKVAQSYNESCTNENSAMHRLSIIDRDLNNNTLTTVKSTAGTKRGLDDSDVQASSSKRK